MIWTRPIESYAPSKERVASRYCEESDIGGFTICRVMLNGQAWYELWRKIERAPANMLASLGPVRMEDLSERRKMIDVLKDTAESML